MAGVGVIRILPEAVANQIAAGEVVQRPASVVKELVENAVDAGASSISLYIQEGGRESIQVIDDGCGLSPDDARRAFERHATSKITRADDLYALSTFGFRGEALPSIASVSELELRTRRAGDEVGLRLPVVGGVFGEPSPVNIQCGTQIIVKNLFYNVPARRKFLKSKSVETRHIVDEFQRVALCNPGVAMELYDNDVPRHRLPSGNLRQRIVAIFGKHINAGLLDLRVETSIIRVEGFIGTPAAAKKSGAAEEFLFVNGRYFRSPYLHRAIVSAYEKLIAPGMFPAYFLYLTVDPARIDVNIHPTKTEIKFEDEQAIWQILSAAVRESMGKTGAVPLMDFDTRDAIEIPVYRPDRTGVREPRSALNPHFNPFENDVPTGWEALYKDGYDTFDPSTSEGDTFRRLILDEEAGTEDTELDEFISGGFEADAPADGEWAEQGTLEIESGMSAGLSFLKLSNRYAAVAREGGLTIVDLPRAHHRILYERFLARGEGGNAASQQEFFPEPVALSPEDLKGLEELRPDLSALGFDIETREKTAIVRSVPADIQGVSPAELIDSLLEELRRGGSAVADNRRARVVLSLADACCARRAKNRQAEEIEEIILSLRACREPAFTADGRPILTVLSADEIKKRLS